MLPGLEQPGLSTSSGVLDPSAWYGRCSPACSTSPPAPSVLETVAWLAYGIPVLVIFLWPARKRQAAGRLTTPPRRPRRAVGEPSMRTPRLLALVAPAPSAARSPPAATTADDNGDRRQRRPDHRQGVRHRLRGRQEHARRRHQRLHDHQRRQQGHRVLRVRAGRPGHGRGGEHRPRPLPRAARRAARRHVRDRLQAGHDRQGHPERADRLRFGRAR